MEWQVFEDNIRYIMNNLFDFAALETNEQIFTVIKPPAGVRNRGDYIRQVIKEAIEELKPGRNEGSINSPEWRPYYILQKRYIDGMNLNELSVFLSISTRQLRRDHHRSLEALTILLWNRYFPDEPHVSSPEDTEEEEQENFEVHPELLDLGEIINGVYGTLKKHFEDNQISVQINHPKNPINITADRVILRQVTIGIFNEIGHNHKLERIQIDMIQDNKEAVVEFKGYAIAYRSALEKSEAYDVETLNAWSEKINARLEGEVAHRNEKVLLTRKLYLKKSLQRVILVVDDQEPAINMFKRYLSQTDWNVVGTNQGDQIIPLVQKHQPELITLDIMMPQVDGWELLQTLKMNDITRNIPVIVCSAWVDPELARSLGASAYLKKPITQKMFLESLENIGIL